jgi:glycosyltransferase involved in cell wall biosynthesis
MKILYVAGGLAILPGVRKKVVAQVKAFKENNCEPFLFLYDFSGVREVSRTYSFLVGEGISQYKTFSPQKTRGIVNTFMRRKRLFYEVLRCVEESACDVVFFRYPMGDPFFCSFLDKVKKPVVTEHQCKELIEISLSGKGIIYWSERLFRGAIRKKLSGMVGVTQEITDYQLALAGVSLHRDKGITIGNGVDVQSLPLRCIPKGLEEDSELHLLFVAHVSLWHGVDRLIRGLAGFCAGDVGCSGHKKIVLHIVGQGSAVPELETLVKKHGLEKRVFFHGPLYGPDLDAMFDRCHIGVGSLGVHRKGLRETSELKAREYCARGIPFITAFGDPDFDETFPYIKKFPVSEKAIDMLEVRSFAERVLQDPEHPQKMREYAEKTLNWTPKMKKLVSFFGKILKNE